ncbi:MAG: potassium channel family protein [Actinobacteria bacterium]|nr:potassium channel family protein [Actinomycetota bacterium]
MAWGTRAWRWVRANPSATLLVVQLLGILLYAFVDDVAASSPGRLLLSLFGMLVVVLALAVVRATPTYTWLGVLIGVPAVILTVVDWATGDPAWHLASDLVHVAFYGYTLTGLLRYMFADEEVTKDEIWAIGATFTVAVWLWAYAYSAVQGIVPGSFTAAVNPDAQRTWLELLFLSTTTMTSTGLSDVVPIKPVARAIVMIQQIAGMLYLAVAVSRIVGLTINRRRVRETS